jgi:periplasmic divalent cation tolerance protein
MHIGWTTVESAADAERLARGAVEARLAACVQIDGPIMSYYRWDEEVTSAQEYRLTFKFLAENSERLEEWLNRNHPYEIPEWLTVAADRIAPAYKGWAEADAESAVIIDKSGKDSARGLD